MAIKPPEVRALLFIPPSRRMPLQAVKDVCAGGQPMGWISWQEAVLLYARDQVMWTVGDEPLRFHGGINRWTGLRSHMDVHPVIAAEGQVFIGDYSVEAPLTNRELFRRDRHTCLYCLAQLADRHLTREHVIPVSRGGEDTWSNVVSACRVCNEKKADRTPQQAGKSSVQKLIADTGNGVASRGDFDYAYVEGRI